MNFALKLTILAFTVLAVANAQSSANSMNSTDNCFSNPCLNQGVCTYTHYGQKKCTCPQHYFGPICQFKYCTQVQCLNGGKCDSNSQTDSCVCSSFYNGTSCENGPFCHDNYCQNNGICSIEPGKKKPTCTCPSAFIGDRCQTAMPQKFWTLNEQCKASFGPYVYAQSQDAIYDFWKSYNDTTSVNMNYFCEWALCKSIDSNFYINIQPVNGTICGPDRVCADKKCLKAPNVPIDLSDTYIVEDLSCELLLFGKNKHYAPYFCNDSWFKSKCPVVCRLFLTEKDQDALCPFYSELCHGGSLPGSNVSVAELCPNTCAHTHNHKLECPSDNNVPVCLNGGTCVNDNTTSSQHNHYKLGFIGFKCDCPAGYSGLLCQIFDPCVNNTCGVNETCKRISRYNYGCFVNHQRHTTYVSHDSTQ